MKPCGALRMLCSRIRWVILVSVAGFPVKFLEVEEEVVELGRQEGGSRSLLSMDRSLYERPEKRVRLTILDDNDSRVGAHEGVSSSLVIVVSRLLWLYMY